MFVRTNGPGSHHVKADIAVVLRASADGINCSQTRNNRGFADVRRINTDHRNCRNSAWCGNVEILVNDDRGRLTGLAFGAEDFITDIGGRRPPEGLEVVYARSRVLLATRLAGLQALDQVFTAIRDDDAFRRDAEVGRTTRLWRQNVHHAAPG